MITCVIFDFFISFRLSGDACDLSSRVPSGSILSAAMDRESL